MSGIDGFAYAPHESKFFGNQPEQDDDIDEDAETASQRSISLSSPARSPRHSTFASVPLHAHDMLSRRESGGDSIDIDFTSETDDVSEVTSEIGGRRESSITSAAPSVYEDPKVTLSLPTYPPTPSSAVPDSSSVTSASSTYSRKVRPESVLLEASDGPLVLGIALVDFNHLEGPKIEFSQGDIFEDDEIAKIIPFLALPDGAHMSLEDYSYFHLVPSKPNPSTVFGISCNRQIAAATLLVKDADVTRSIVQKAVVVISSKPVFGPIRDKLGVVTRALFQQRDFRETGILVDFAASLEVSLRSHLTESGLYIATSLRELVHTFRQRTLVLLKALMLQKKIIFYGHPVERLCIYQYSLVSLIPGLLQALQDCGSPPLSSRASALSRPSSLRTSDRRSLLAYTGLPLDIFGKDAFFQPYLPLQQLDMLKDTRSWLCGSTNSIVTQQREIDLLVDIEAVSLEFRDPRLERLIALTPADRKWMDEIVKDVNESWDDDDSSIAMHFKGSDDYLRAKFEEYVSSALASVRYRDFLAKGKGNGVIITGGSGVGANSTDDFNALWIAEFTKTNAYEVWERTTDPMLFDIIEPRHPCNDRPSVVADIGLRLSEGIQELKLEQQLAPTREAISKTIAAGSTNFFKAVEGMRDRWQQRAQNSPTTSDLSSTPGTPVSITRSESEAGAKEGETNRLSSSTSRQSFTAPSVDLARPLSVAASETRATLGSWGVGISSFLSTRAARFSTQRTSMSSAKLSDATSPPSTPAASLKNDVRPSAEMKTVDEDLVVGEEFSQVYDSSEREHIKDSDSEGEPAGMAL